MASPETIASGATGNTGALAADTVFYVKTGKIHLSTDAGTSNIPFDNGEKVIVSSGQTVTWENRGTESVILEYMPI